MSFIDYIRGKRKGKEANRIEKDAMRDAFLYEAIEGYDAVDADHMARIEAMQNKIKSRSMAKRRKPNPVWKVAAVACLLLFGLGGYLFVDNKQTKLLAQNKAESAIDIYVPLGFYEENRTTIEEKNLDVEEYFHFAIIPFQVNENMLANVSKKELETLSQKVDTAVIPIYVPTDYYEQHKTTIEQYKEAALHEAASVEEKVSAINIYIPANTYEQYREKIGE